MFQYDSKIRSITSRLYKKDSCACSYKYHPQSLFSSFQDTYHKDFEVLRQYKAQIERLQMMLEQSKQKMQRGFEDWLKSLLLQGAPLSDLSVERNNTESIMNENTKQSLQFTNSANNARNNIFGMIRSPFSVLCHIYIAFF